METVTQNEILLAAEAGGQTELPDPVTRKEMFLAKAAGIDVETPEPVTREEMFLSRIGSGAENPQGGGGTEKEWKLIFEKTFTEADVGTAYWEFTLDTPAEEVVVIDSNLRSNQEMGWHIKINGTSICENLKYLTDDTKNRNRQTYCAYKGDVWKVDVGEYGYDALGYGANLPQIPSGGAYTIVGKLPIVGKATKIRFAQSTVQDFQVYSGTVRIYAR